MHVRSFKEKMGQRYCSDVFYITHSGCLHHSTVNAQSSLVTHSCRLCLSIVAANRVLSLFSAGGLRLWWASRITDLLQVQVVPDDGHSQYACNKCTRRIESLERAVLDLDALGSKLVSRTILKHQEKLTTSILKMLVVTPLHQRQRNQYLEPNG